MVFLKWNGEKLIFQKGLEYEIDRAKWSTYANFYQMYDGIILEYIATGVAKERETLALIDEMGNVVEKRCIWMHGLTLYY